MPKLFTTTQNVVVDLEKLERKALKCLQKIKAQEKSTEIPSSVSREAFWYWIQGTAWGTHELRHPDSSIEHLYDRPYLHSPWAEKLSALKPSKRPRILFVGTGIEVGELKSRVRKQEFRDVLVEHGIGRWRRWSRCGGAVRFWDRFFNTDSYLTTPRSVPTLILATGLIRASFGNTSSTECAYEIIAAHAAHWNIPVVQVKSTSR